MIKINRSIIFAKKKLRPCLVGANYPHLVAHLLGPFNRENGHHDQHSPLEAVIKTLVTFHYTGWLIGILIMAYQNP